MQEYKGFFIHLTHAEAQQTKCPNRGVGCCYGVECPIFRRETNTTGTCGWTLYLLKKIDDFLLQQEVFNGDEDKADK